MGRCHVRRRSELGQATVELAAVIPLFLLVTILLVQVGTVLLDQLAVVQAARAGARIAAVDSAQGAAAAAAGRATGLEPDRLSVTVGSRPDADGMVRVRVRYTSQIKAPFTGSVLLRPQVEGTAAMRVEGES